MHVWLVIQSYPTLFDPMDCSPPGSFVHGIFQARMLEWVAMPFSGGSSQPRDWTQVSCIAGGFFAVWANREGGRLSIFLPPHTNTHTHTLLVLFSLAFPSSGDFPFLWTAWTNSRGSQIPGALDSQKLSLVIPKMQRVPFSQFGFSKSGMGLRNTALHTLSGGSHQFSCL